MLGLGHTYRRGQPSATTDEMTVGSGAVKPTVCSLAYYDSPEALPPMLNEGISLANCGVAVEAICLAGDRSGPQSESCVAGFRTTRLPLYIRGVFAKRRTPRALTGAMYGASYAEYVTKAIRQAYRARADLYVANDLPTLLPALVAARLRGKPVVYRAHELYSEAHPQTPLARFWRLLDRLLVPWCDRVVTPDENRSEIYRTEYRASRSPLTVRNCPPHRDLIESTWLQDELRRRGLRASTIVLYQGLIDSMRCVEELAEATHLFEEGIVLAILGSGHGAWQNPAAALAGYERIVVLPRVPYRELPPITASADIGVLLYRNNCRNNYYCAPNKVFEYMMMGVPVVASRFPGMARLVEGEGVGVCVDPEDSAEIARAVNQMARDPERRRVMRANALRASAERYNWEREFARLWECYRGLIQGAAAAARD